MGKHSQLLQSPVHYFSVYSTISAALCASADDLTCGDKSVTNRLAQLLQVQVPGIKQVKCINHHHDFILRHIRFLHAFTSLKTLFTTPTIHIHRSNPPSGPVSTIPFKPTINVLLKKIRNNLKAWRLPSYDNRQCDPKDPSAPERRNTKFLHHF